MEKEKTFQNLLVLKQEQEKLKGILGDKYEKAIIPFVEVIQLVMKSKAVNEFEALLILKNESELYQRKSAPAFFSAALMEITEANSFNQFKK